MNITKEEALKRIKELEAYIKEKDKNTFDVNGLSRDVYKIVYKKEDIVYFYDDECFKIDCYHNRDIELCSLYEQNLPKGYTFEIKESQLGFDYKVLAMVKKDD